MNEIENLSYYPKFIFNTSDGKAFSTTSLDTFKHLKEIGRNNKINRFVKGQNINITTTDESDNIEVKLYEVTKIEIQNIKYEINEPDYGVNMNDSLTEDKEKKILMEIYIFLELKS